MIQREEYTLKVGDVLYGGSGGTLNIRVEIDRVTNTQAVSGERRFKKVGTKGSYWTEIGDSNRWCRTLFYLETQELERKYQRKRAEDQYIYTSPRSLSTEALLKIQAILEEEKSKPKEPTGEAK